MGEIAEMMISGILCCQCGVVLDEEIIDMQLDIPIICNSCFEELSQKDKAKFEHQVEKFFLKNNKLERGDNNDK